jgi:hypothetical protein
MPSSHPIPQLPLSNNVKEIWHSQFDCAIDDIRGIEYSLPIEPIQETNLISDYYGQSHHGTRISKTTTGTIRDEDLEGMGVVDQVKDIANTLFIKTVGSRIVRGNTRRGLVFGCIFVAYRMIDKTQNPNVLLKLFDIPRKHALKGLYILNVSCPDVRKFTHMNAYSTCKCILESLGYAWAIDEVYAQYVATITRPDFPHRRIVSVLGGVIYSWSLVNAKDLSITQIAQHSHVSSSTLRTIKRSC